MGVVYEIQSLRRNEKKYVSGSTPLCEIVVTKYTIVHLKKHFFLENGFQDQLGDWL